MAMLRVCNLALLAIALLSAQPSLAGEPLVLDANGNVQRFYGIPVTLTREDLERLHLPTSKAEVQGGEGLTETVYTITTKEGVEVEVTFEDSGKLYAVETLSANALGPRKIGVGSTLAEVRAAWPEGAFMFGFADGYYVTFATGTNLLYRFNPDDMPPGAFNHGRPDDFPVPDTIKVQKLSLYPKPIPVSASKRQPIDLSKTSASVLNSKYQEIFRVDIERAPGSPVLRLVSTRNGKIEANQSIDISEYPDIDIWGSHLASDENPVVISFRNGDYKQCDVSEDDRDQLYVTLGDSGSSISAHPPKGITLRQSPKLPKYVGNMMNSAAHGCRRTYDAKLGTFGLEKDDGAKKGSR